MGKQQWKDLSLLIKQALDNPDILPVLQDKLIDKGLDKCSTMFDKYYDSLYNYRSFNTNIQGLRRLRVSNTIERLNAEIKRRTKKIGAFPSDDSAMRLAGSIMMDINEEYVTGRKYINTYIRLSWRKLTDSKVIYNLQKIIYIIIIHVF